LQYQRHSAIFIKHHLCHPVGCNSNTSSAFRQDPLRTLLASSKVITRQQGSGSPLCRHSFPGTGMPGYASWRQDEDRCPVQSASQLHSAPSGHVAAFSGAINFYLADAIVSSKRGRHGVLELLGSVAVAVPLPLCICLFFFVFFALAFYSPAPKLFVFITSILAALSFFSAEWQRCSTRPTPNLLHSQKNKTYY